MEESEILALAEKRAKLFDKEIGLVFAGNVRNLHDAIRYHIAEPGKRLRPLLAFMTCEALGSDPKKVVPFAAACDILQHWILVHDDIEDGDEVRRGQPAVWKKYGLAHGINIGDYMEQKVYELIIRSKNYGVDDATVISLVQIMIDATTKTAVGQALDMNLRSNNRPTEKEYMEMITAKTAHYLTVPIIGGALISGRKDIIPRIIEYGKAIGPAFQIKDDLLDLTTGKGRGEIGRDIKEGKRSLLVVHCLQNCSSAEKRRLIAILNKPVGKTTKGDVAFAKRLFKKYGSIGYGELRASELLAKARKIAKNMPPRLCAVMTFFADYLEKRSK